MSNIPCKDCLTRPVCINQCNTMFSASSYLRAKCCIFDEFMTNINFSLRNADQLALIRDEFADIFGIWDNKLQRRKFK